MTRKEKKALVERLLDCGHPFEFSELMGKSEEYLKAALPVYEENFKGFCNCYSEYLKKLNKKG